MAKSKKSRAKKYEEKVSIKGSFEDVIKVSLKDADKKKGQHPSFDSDDKSSKNSMEQK